jgi:hypothetical protein
MGSRPRGTPETSERCVDFNCADARFQTTTGTHQRTGGLLSVVPKGSLPSETMWGLFFRRDFDPGFGPLQRIERAVDVDGGIAAGQALLGALFGFACTIDVNF